LHSEGADLHDQHVPESIDDQAGKPVPFRVNEAKAARLLAGQAEQLACRHRALDAGAEKSSVEPGRAVAYQKADRDRRPRGVEAPPQEVAARVHDADFVARRRASFDPVDGLGVNPRMPRPNRLHMTGLQVNRGHDPLSYPFSWCSVNAWRQSPPARRLHTGISGGKLTGTSVAATR